MHLGPQFSSVCTINSNLSPKVLVATRKQRVDITGVSVGTLVGRGGVLGYVLCCYDLVRRREWTEITHSSLNIGSEESRGEMLN